MARAVPRACFPPGGSGRRPALWIFSYSRPRRRHNRRRAVGHFRSGHFVVQVPAGTQRIAVKKPGCRQVGTDRGDRRRWMTAPGRDARPTMKHVASPLWRRVREYAHASLFPAARQPAESKADYAAGKRPNAGCDHHGTERTAPDDERRGCCGIFRGVLTADDGPPSLAHPLIEGVERRCQLFPDRVDRGCSFSGSRHSYLQAQSPQEAGHGRCVERRASRTTPVLSMRIGHGRARSFLIQRGLFHGVDPGGIGADCWAHARRFAMQRRTSWDSAETGLTPGSGPVEPLLLQLSRRDTYARAARARS